MIDTSRVWVYQSDRELTTAEQNSFSQILSRFVSQWNAHGKALQGGFEVLKNHFIILWVNEENHAASGCSIDSSVKCIKEIESNFKLNLTDKSIIAFKIADKIELIHFNKIKEAIQQGRITEGTIMFDNSVANHKEFTNRWQVKAADSWVKRFF